MKVLAECQIMFELSKGVGRLTHTDFPVSRESLFSTGSFYKSACKIPQLIVAHLLILYYGSSLTPPLNYTVLIASFKMDSRLVRGDATLCRGPVLS